MPIYDRLEEAQVPCVTIGQTNPRQKYSVISNQAGMLAEGAELLESHGHRGFALMYLEDAPRDPDDPAMAIAEESRILMRSTVGFDQDRLIPVPWSRDFRAAYDLFRQWCLSPNRPNAIFFTDDVLFDVASRAVLELGLEIPKNLAIVTYANTGRQFVFPVQVTSVGFDHMEVMRAAWGMLRRLIEGEDVEEPLVVVRSHVTLGDSL
jgi:DNA-binding LacI/PurR family transcriptional regulator